MRRRAFLILASWVVLAGAARPEATLLRRARFYDHGDRVTMDLALPELLRPWDREAMAWLDSGFETLLVYDVALFEHGTNRLVERHRDLVKLRYDYMGGARYELKRYRDGRFVRRRTYERPREAVRAAVRLRRTTVADAGKLTRAGARGPSYYVTVVAQRNPIDDAVGAVGPDPSVGRGQGRDVQWFQRLVHFLAGELPTAEVSLRVRTQPFYLEVR